MVFTVVMMTNNTSDDKAIAESAPAPRLLDQARDRLRLKHYSIRTEQAYLGWIRRFILFHGKRHPAEMGKAEVEAFLTALAVERNVAAATRGQALAAILFLYQEVLDQRLPWPTRSANSQTSSSCAMVAAQMLIFGRGGRQTGELQFAAQGVDDAQNILKSQGRLSRFQIDDKAHADPGRQRQARLRQAELLAGSAQRRAELLR